MSLPIMFKILDFLYMELNVRRIDQISNILNRTGIFRNFIRERTLPDRNRGSQERDSDRVKTNADLAPDGNANETKQIRTHCIDEGLLIF